MSEVEIKEINIVVALQRIGFAVIVPVQIAEFGYCRIILRDHIHPLLYMDPVGGFW